MSTWPLALDFGDARVGVVVPAVQSGDVVMLAGLLQADPILARVRVGTRQGQKPVRTLMHVVTDWPGHLPRAAAMIGLLAEAGADVDARLHGGTGETPLHWAASSDDVPALDALLQAGAEIDLAGASIAGGTALTLACAFAQWNAARFLVEHGATSGLWEAAALGQLDRLSELMHAEHPSPAEVTGAFWGACHGGQIRTAEYLLSKGADQSWVGWDGLTPRGAAERAKAGELLRWLAAQPQPPQTD